MSSLPFKDKVQARAHRRGTELELWHKWKAGDQNALADLFKSLTPLMKRTSMSFHGNLPEAYIDAVVKKHTLKALHTYDPKSAQLNTHIMHRMNKVKRDVSQYQNPGRLAESSHWKVTNYQNVHSNLKEDLGRDPTHIEVAHAMSRLPDEVSPEEVKRIQSGTRRDLASVEGQNKWKPPEQQEMHSMLENLSHELSPVERKVLHMTFGMRGHSPSQAKDISNRMGITVGRVSQIKKDLYSKVEKHYGNRPASSY